MQSRRRDVPALKDGLGSVPRSKRFRVVLGENITLASVVTKIVPHEGHATLGPDAEMQVRKDGGAGLASIRWARKQVH